MQTSRGGGMEDGQTPFIKWVKANASTANLVSIILLVFAAWSAVEIVTNVVGNEVPPVTGIETNSDPDDNQRTNNGLIIGLGAVAGTLGLILQLMIPREQSNENELPDPVEDEEIDEVVDGLMEDEESSEEEIDDSGVEDSDQEGHEQDSTEDGDSIEEEEEVPEDEGEVSDDSEAPEAEKKAPVKKKKF